MKNKSKRSVVTDAWGIDDGFEDALYDWRPTPPEARAAILAAMGVDEGSPPPPSRTILIDRSAPAASHALPSAGGLILEDGTTLRCEGELPPDLPVGYHHFWPSGGGPGRLVMVSPGQCPLPEGLKTWGWAAQLYATRSSASWGIGDLADLRRLGKWSAELGAGLTLVNPLFAPAPTTPRESSPYYPSSRRFYDPLYLRVEEVPGAKDAGINLPALSAAGRQLNTERRINREEIFTLKNGALESIWSRFSERSALRDEFQGFAERRGRELHEFALYCVLAEEHGRDYRTWPAPFRDREAAALDNVAQEKAGRINYHKWLQWALDLQLAAATETLPIVHDLPVGVDPGGADAWAWQDVLAPRMSIGAPPDIYNTLGQNWGLPPFIPHKLRAADFRPFLETIRAGLRHTHGLRIDHVLGLFRLYWIPYEFSAAQGAFVRYPTDELLAILAIESERAGAFIMGEDLGTVENVVQAKLAKSRSLSYRVVWFEDDPPATYPALSLAAVTTHDLPTIAGLWSGADLEAQRQTGRNPNEREYQKLRDNLQKLVGVETSAPAETVIERTYAALATAPSAVIAPTLDDALAVEERPNMPGTTTEWPNWSLALPEPLEAIEQRPLPKAIARLLSGR